MPSKGCLYYMWKKLSIIITITIEEQYFLLKVPESIKVLKLWVSSIIELYGTKFSIALNK